MTLYEWHLVLDDEFGKPLWGIEERDEMIAAGVLVVVPYVPVEPDYEAAEEAFSERSTDSRSMAGSCLDALQQGGAIVNDRDVVRLETWFQ